jgi:hypothetical protein
MSKKTYQPKKPKYKDLSSLAREMIDEKVRMVFTGIAIETKNQRFTMYDGEILVRDFDSK